MTYIAQDLKRYTKRNELIGETSTTIQSDYVYTVQVTQRLRSLKRIIVSARFIKAL